MSTSSTERQQDNIIEGRLEWSRYADDDILVETLMEFYLRYRGPLPATARGDSRAKDKDRIRHFISPQLEEFWKVYPPLSRIALHAMPIGIIKGNRVESNDFGVHPANRFYRISFKQWHFIPLVTRSNEWVCNIAIRFLRRSDPGDVIQQDGDLDNRLKTFFDGLRIPHSEPEVITDTPNKRNCFCLLEDDSLIAGFSIETGRLLGPLGEQETESDVDISIHVTVKGTNRSLTMI